MLENYEYDTLIGDGQTVTLHNATLQYIGTVIEADTQTERERERERSTPRRRRPLLEPLLTCSYPCSRYWTDSSAT